MLYGGDYPAVVKPVDTSAHHFRHLFGVAAEGAFSYYSVLRIGENVRHGCKINVEAVILDVSTYGLSSAVGLFGVAGTADLVHRRNFRYRKARIGDPSNAAALFIEGHKQRNSAGVLQAFCQALDLFGRLEIAAEH